ncbi:Tartrate-resistant acid phosphatase type 5 [Durusdinium trenchii]|uniref:Tartrate-resistant acid phosphatase type 5 n=1 Tax=Durusdinium trenchii TaxID=1381693 RepID=A0ABP0LFT4_9DINO
MAGRLLLQVTLLYFSQCIQLSQSRILLFWSVDGSKRTQDTVRANIRHVKDLGIEHDVMLAHYRGSPADWNQKWYKEHVLKSISGMGYKFHFLQKAYEAGDWEKRYEFVWALDSDIDISKADVSNFLEMARHMNSAIIGPTFVEKEHMSLAAMQDSARVIRREGHSPTRHSRHHHGYQASGPNKIQEPDPGCDFRHTDFVELTAPLLKSSVLKQILVDCKHCIHERSDWGLDMMWCNYVSERFGHGCALVDKTPVVHLDWALAPISPDFYAAMHAVQARYKRYWSEHRVLDCKHQQGGLVENIAEETIAPAPEKHRKRKHKQAIKTRTNRELAKDEYKPSEESENEDDEPDDGLEAEQEAGNEEEEETDQQPSNEQTDDAANAEEDGTDENGLSAKSKTAASAGSAGGEDERGDEEDTTRSAQKSVNTSAQTESKSSPSNSSQAQKEENDQQPSNEQTDDAEEDGADENGLSAKSKTAASARSAGTTQNTSSVAGTKDKSASEDEGGEDEKGDEEDTTQSAQKSVNTSAQTGSKSLPSNSSDSTQKESEDESAEGSAFRNGTSSKTESEVEPSEGIFKVKASGQPDTLNDGLDPGASWKHSPGAFPMERPTQDLDALKRKKTGASSIGVDVNGPTSAKSFAHAGDGKEGQMGQRRGSAVDAEGHIEKTQLREERKPNLASLKDAEEKLRDDLEQLKKLEEALKVEISEKSKAEQGHQKTQAEHLYKGTKTTEHHKKRHTKHKHSKVQQAVSLIDLDSTDDFDLEESQESQSMRIQALAAAARKVALEAVEEVQTSMSMGTMSSEQRLSTRKVALESVQAAIAKEVQKQESHEKEVEKLSSKLLHGESQTAREAALSEKVKELKAALQREKQKVDKVEEEKVNMLASRLTSLSTGPEGRQQLLLAAAKEILELKAHVEWDQKRMQSDMEEELELKNHLKQVEAELRARQKAPVLFQDWHVEQGLAKKQAK